MCGPYVLLNSEGVFIVGLCFKTETIHRWAFKNKVS